MYHVSRLSFNLVIKKRGRSMYTSFREFRFRWHMFWRYRLRRFFEVVPEKIGGYQYLWETIDCVRNLELRDLSDFRKGCLADRIPIKGFITGNNYRIVHTKSGWKLIDITPGLPPRTKGSESSFNAILDKLEPETVIAKWRVYKK